MAANTARFAACAAALLALTAYGLSVPHPIPGQFGIGYGVELDKFVALACIQGVIYAAAAALVLRGGAPPLWLILGTAALLRLILLPAPPFLSNDLYRYIWDGWVQDAGINPYRYLPVDPALAFLRDSDVFPNINRATYAHTIYPPAAEMMFCVIAMSGKLLAMPPVFWMKTGMTALEAIGISAMLGSLRRAGLPAARILLYAWNPLPVWEFAGNGHVDAIAVCFIALGFYAAASRKSGLSATALAGAVLAKFLPVILLPAIWRRWDWKFVTIFTGVIIALYLPYLSVGAGVLGFLGGYADQEGIASGQGVFLFSALQTLLPVPDGGIKLYLGALALLLIGLAARAVFRSAPSGPPHANLALLLIGLLMAGLSPHYPWYYAWVLVPACLAAQPIASLYLVSASFLLYLNPTHTKLFWPACVFLPFIALGARDLWASRLTSSNHGAMP